MRMSVVAILGVVLLAALGLAFVGGDRDWLQSSSLCRPVLSRLKAEPPGNNARLAPDTITVGGGTINVKPEKLN
jgi:hypothetical protein